VIGLTIAAHCGRCNPAPQCRGNPRCSFSRLLKKCVFETVWM
jgi:hypothetical protein